MTIKKAPEGANKNTHINNTTKDRLLSILQNSDRVMSREELCGILRISDRQVRRYKGQLLDEGHPIASTAHEAGYAYGDKALCRQSSKEYFSRANKELRRGRVLKRAAAPEEKPSDQLTIGEVMQL